MTSRRLRIRGIILFLLFGDLSSLLAQENLPAIIKKNTKPQEEGMFEVEGLLKKGKSYLCAGDYEKAILYFEKAVQKNSLSAETYFQLGLAYNTLGRNQKAVKAYKQGISFKPDDAEAYFNLGLAYVHLGDKELTLEEEYKILKNLNQKWANMLFKLINK